MSDQKTTELARILEDVEGFLYRAKEHLRHRNYTKCIGWMEAAMEEVRKLEKLSHA